MLKESKNGDQRQSNHVESNIFLYLHVKKCAIYALHVRLAEQRSWNHTPQDGRGAVSQAQATY